MSSDLIRRDDVLDAVRATGVASAQEKLRIMAAVRAVPVVEAEPVVHAHWVPAPDVGDCCYRCSRCGKVIDHYCDEDDAYCARCGAHMDEEVAHE